MRDKYEVVAENCSQYDPVIQAFVNDTGDFGSSCRNCRRFVGERCEKGVFDQILSNVAFRHPSLFR
ncbi:MAG: hypothetical protein FWG10_02225 [Eubacteriaceae bacterium]|nr:hypothetical protein [Eubacteriaceae bacterium]